MGGAVPTKPPLAPASAPLLRRVVDSPEHGHLRARPRSHSPGAGPALGKRHRSRECRVCDAIASHREGLAVAGAIGSEALERQGQPRGEGR